MLTQNELIDMIVKILSKEEQVCKVYFFASYLVNGRPYEATLIIYENCETDYIIAQHNYEKLLKEVGNHVALNILPVNKDEAQRSLDRRLQGLLCIYEKKEKD